METMTSLHFDPVTKAHIMRCSVHRWYPKYKTITPKTRLIPLTSAFVDYLRADGIVLPDDEPPQQPEWDSDSGVYSETDQSEEADDTYDVATGWRDIHDQIKSTIAELGGVVMPKLNWSAPKDATFMSTTNSMRCHSPDDIYLLLKSSNFVTHDLEHAFDDCIDTPECSLSQEDIPYYLVLRKYFELNPAFEFRCFVRRRQLLCICQRELTHQPGLFKIQNELSSRILEFFETRLVDTFEDDDFVFDCYVPKPHDRVWLIDINPWSLRTDPILFSWAEILDMRTGPSGDISEGDEADDDEDEDEEEEDDDDDDDEDDADDHHKGHQPIEDTESDVELVRVPEMRLILPGDPEAAFSTPQYSAHKLPRDVVEATQSREGLMEFAKNWEELLAKRQQEDAEAGDSDSDGSRKSDCLW